MLCCQIVHSNSRNLLYSTPASWPQKHKKSTMNTTDVTIQPWTNHVHHQYNAINHTCTDLAYICKEWTGHDLYSMQTFLLPTPLFAFHAAKNVEQCYSLLQPKMQGGEEWRANGIFTALQPVHESELTLNYHIMAIRVWDGVKLSRLGRMKHLQRRWLLTTWPARSATTLIYLYIACSGPKGVKLLANTRLRPEWLLFTGVTPVRVPDAYDLRKQRLDEYDTTLNYTWDGCLNLWRL